MLPGTELEQQPRVDHARAVKKYRRSAAGKDPEIFPEDIRPPAVLKVFSFVYYIVFIAYTHVHV